MKLYLKRLRQERGYTQEQMAKMVGEKPRTYGSWERGEAMLNLEQAYKCARALGCTLNDLVTEPTTEYYVLSIPTNNEIEDYDFIGKDAPHPLEDIFDAEDGISHED